MKTIAEDKETITIRFTRDEAANVRAAINYVSSLFEFLDREALDGWRMTIDEAEQMSDEFFALTTNYFIRAQPGASRSPNNT